MLEIWKDIKGYEGLYMVSNLGRVKNLPRNNTIKKERILKQGNVYKNITEAYIALNKKVSGNIYKCLKGGRKTAYGCYWIYLRGDLFETTRR